MADEDAVTPATTPGEHPVPEGQAGIGQRLRESREARELTAEAAAVSLHMDVSILRALEDEAFVRLGAPVFVRGHLRRYATLLGLNGDELLARYERDSPPEPMPTRPAQARERFAVDDGLNWPVVLGVVTVLLLVILAVWRLWGQAGEPVPVSTDAFERDIGGPMPGENARVLSDARLPAVGPSQSGGPEDVSAYGSGAGASASGAETLVEPAAEAASAQAAPVMSDDTVEIVVRLDDECWTEITDAAGRRLYFGMGEPEQRIAVRGRAPISVLLGNARAASMEVDGRAWPMSGDDISGNVARLRIEDLR